MVGTDLSAEDHGRPMRLWAGAFQTACQFRESC